MSRRPSCCWEEPTQGTRQEERATGREIERSQEEKAGMRRHAAGRRKEIDREDRPGGGKVIQK